MSAPRSRQSRLQTRVTLRDVARAAGVSAQTVSCVVNRTGSISEDVRERVAGIAERMGYMPNRNARAMRTGRSAIIGVIVLDMRKPFYPGLVQAIEGAAARSGNVILLIDIHGSGEGLERRLASLRMHGVDGILTTDYSDAIAALKLPTVVIGGPVPDMDCVHADDSAGGTAIAELLIKRGHRSIGLVSSRSPGCVAVRREAMIGRLAGGAAVAWESFVGANGGLTQAIRRLLGERSVTAVACSSDEIAIEVMHALEDEGIDVPGEMSVAGFDDIPWATVIRPALTTVRQPTEGLARMAVKMLAERMENPARGIRHVALPVRLMERQTVRDLAGGS